MQLGHLFHFVMHERPVSRCDGKNHRLTAVPHIMPSVRTRKERQQAVSFLQHAQLMRQIRFINHNHTAVTENRTAISYNNTAVMHNGTVIILKDQHFSQKVKTLPPNLSVINAYE